MATKRGQNWSQQVRDYVGAHPEAKTAEVAKAVGVSPGLAYKVMARMKGKAKKATKRGKRTKAPAAPKGLAAQLGAVRSRLEAKIRAIDELLGD